MNAIHRTDELRAAAEAVSALRLDDFAAVDDPIAILRSLHATLHALHSVWPEVSIASGFEDPFGDDASEFTDDIERGLRLAEDGLQNAIHAPRAEEE
ncbi:hypothetical protein ABT119_05710 [Streptomyces sp. NPDC001910]|uniref:hypothetical protein n=1 Tax=Streptomyces sp. NPDC001910 TaxID=3154403 RepID=UPI00332529F9